MRNRIRSHALGALCSFEVAAALPLVACHAVDSAVDRVTKKHLDDAVGKPECSHAIDCDSNEVCVDGECKTADEL